MPFKMNINLLEISMVVAFHVPFLVVAFPYPQEEVVAVTYQHHPLCHVSVLLLIP
jgi:hypothetical protein